jgi:hypothetical protein
MGNKEFSMKNLLKLLGLITLVAVIGFSMIACDTGGWAFGSRTAPSPGPGPGPGPGPSSEVVLFEDGEWAEEVTEEFGGDDPSNPDTYIITFETPIDLTDCTKLILEFTSGEMANQYWHGGQLASLGATDSESDDLKLNYWGGQTLFNSATKIWTFDFTKADSGSDTLTALEEIVTKSWTAQPVLKKVYLDKTAVAPPPPPPPPPPGFPVELGDPDDVADNAKMTWNLDWDDFTGATYFVVETEGPGDNSWGFGTLQFVLQGDGDSWNWNESATGNWNGLPGEKTAGVTTYIVVELSELIGYDAVIAGTQAKIVVAYYGDTSDVIVDLGFVNAYLAGDDLTSSGSDLKLADGTTVIGFITQDDLGL